MSFRTCFGIYSTNIKLIEVDKLKTTIIFKYKKIILTFFLILFFFTNLFAKESQLAGDAKKALKEYAGYKELINRGYKVNHKRVQRLMHDMGLFGKRPKETYHSYTGEVGKIADNIIDRDFQAALNLKAYGEKFAS